MISQTDKTHLLNFALAGLADSRDGALVAALGLCWQWVHLTKLIQITHAVDSHWATNTVQVKADKNI